MSGSTSTAEASCSRDASAFSVDWWPFAAALLAFAFVASTCDVAHDTRWSAPGPGLTFDEGFNVETGVYLVESGLHYGLALLHPGSLMEIFGDPACNPDHPPLGRIVLGTAHAVLYRLLGDEHAAQRGYVVTYARIGSAFLFACTVAIAIWAGLRWYGPLAGCAAGVSLLLLPRLFGHAHLAALETAMGCAYLLAVVVFGACWGGQERLTVWNGIWAGLVVGLALLTKMQAILLPPILIVWGLWHWRWGAIRPLLVAGVTAGAVFFAGWPWLWLDPVGRVQEYFLRATERQTVYCYYWGERFADRDVPWHYPWVIFLITTPLPLLILLAMGMRGSVGFDSDPLVLAQGSRALRRQRLLLLSTFAPLVLFTLPGTAVYDGERLFLIAWLPAAILMGQGAQVAWNMWLKRSRSRRRALLAAMVSAGLLLVFEAAKVVQIHPCQLAYYNALVGGLQGARERGFEVSYWGDGVTGPFLDQVLEELPRDAVLDVSPVLHPLQLEFMRTQQSWPRSDVKLRGFDVAHLPDVRYLLVLQRRADQWEILLNPPPSWTIVAQEQRRGVPLATLYKIPPQ